MTHDANWEARVARLEGALAQAQAATDAAHLARELTEKALADANARAEKAEADRDTWRERCERARAWIEETMREGEWAADHDAALADDPPKGQA